MLSCSCLRPLQTSHTRVHKNLHVCLIIIWDILVDNTQGWVFFFLFKSPHSNCFYMRPYNNKCYHSLRCSETLPGNSLKASGEAVSFYFAWGIYNTNIVCSGLKIVHAFVSSWLDGWNAIFTSLDLRKKKLSVLQAIQNAAGILYFYSPYFDFQIKTLKFSCLDAEY